MALVGTYDEWAWKHNRIMVISGIAGVIHMQCNAKHNNKRRESVVYSSERRRAVGFVTFTLKAFALFVRE